MSENNDKPRGRGRPALNVQPVLVRLTPDVIERIDAAAGRNRRAEFIRSAVSEKLDRDGK